MAAQEEIRKTPCIRPRRESWWTIARTRNCRTEMLTVSRDEEEIMPVFSFLEEAELYLKLGAYGNGWRVRESSTGELTSMLCGPYSELSGVALDPLPQMLAEKTVGLVRMQRRVFLDRLLSRSREKPQA